MILDILELDDFPANPQVGDIFYHRANNALYLWTTQWVDITEKYPARLPDNFVVRDRLTRISYLGRDWGTFVNELKARLIEKFPDYEDFLESDMGMVLIDLIAYGLDSLAWYQDKWASEMFLDTVVLRKNLCRLARFLGYVPRGVTPAKVKLSFKIEPQTFPVTIPAGFKVKTKTNDIVFEVDSDIKIRPGHSMPDITQNTDATEGETKTIRTVASGENWQTVKLNVPDNKKLAYRCVKVVVGGTEWDETVFWNYSSKNEYKVIYDDNPPYVLFGDNIVAKKPDKGDIISITYRLCSGSSGNVAQNMITELATPLIVKGVDVKLTVTNPQRAIGGIDEEPEEQIKMLAPKFYQTQDRCVSLTDYETLILNFKSTLGAVAKVRAVIEFGIEDDAYLVELMDELKSIQTIPGEQGSAKRDAVYLKLKGYLDGYFNGKKNVNLISFYLLSKDENGQYVGPPPEFVNEDETVNPLLKYLRERTISTVSLRLLDGSVYLRKAKVTIKVKPENEANISNVFSKIEQEIYDFFGRKDFGDAIRLSDVYSIVEAVKGVDYCYVNLEKASGDQGQGITKTENGDLEVPGYLLIVPEQISIELM